MHGRDVQRLQSKGGFQAGTCQKAMGSGRTLSAKGPPTKDVEVKGDFSESHIQENLKEDEGED